MTTFEPYEELLGMIQTHTPFAFSKMNDGELSLIQKRQEPASRGAQPFNEELSEKLLLALQHQQPNYFVGVVCSKCYPSMHAFATAHTASRLNANVLINHNFFTTWRVFLEVLPKRQVVLVCTENARVDDLPVFKPYIVFKVPHQDGWKAYERLKDAWSVCQPNDVVLFCCGPLGRVLVYEWFRHRPELTCLELGSFWDPWLVKRCYSYHTNTLGECTECNNHDILTHDHFGIVKHLLHLSTSVERIYWSDVTLPSILHRYHNDPRRAQVYYHIAAKTAESARHRWYYEWMITHLTFEFEKFSTDDYVEERVQLLESIDPDPIDAVFDLQKHLHNTNRRIEWLTRCAKVPYGTIKNKHFLNEEMYTYKILDELVVVCYYSGKFQQSYDWWKELMTRYDQIPSHHQARCKDNGRYAAMRLGIDGNSDLKEHTDGTL